VGDKVPIFRKTQWRVRVMAKEVARESRRTTLVSEGDSIDNENRWKADESRVESVRG
jgi:hypothetical protein